MRLDRPFLKLPIRFSAEALAEEARAFPRSAWRPHPTGFPGNEAVRLVSPRGLPTDSIAGPMGPTEELLRSPYTMEVMSELGGVWGRSRLMGLGAGADVPPHIDCHYYWVTHLRIHIPVVTNPAVSFTCGDETVHMEPGECWVFDSFRPHMVRNGGSEQRIHLVLDTVGSERLWDLVEAAKSDSHIGDVKTLEPGARRGLPLAYERLNFPTVMAPADMRWLFEFVVDHAEGQQDLEPILKRMDRFLCAWGAAWARFGADGQGLPTYRALISGIQRDLDGLRAQELTLTNGIKVFDALNQLIFTNAFDSELVESQADAAPSQRSMDSVEPEAFAPASKSYRELIDRPIFIVGPPRAGSTLLFETLSRAPRLFATGTESQGLIEKVPGLAPRERNWSSNRLTSEDANSETVERLARDFYERLMDRTWRAPNGSVRMLEKMPKNALRVPFFDAAWPDSTFVYVYRDPRETISSMMEAWQSGGFRTYPGLPGWSGPAWSLLLVPGWQELNGRQPIEIVAHQWAITTHTLINDLEELPLGRVFAVDYADLVADPQQTMQSLCSFLSVDWDVQLERQLPLSKATVSPPKRDKWRLNEQIINSVLPIVAEADAEARAFVQKVQQASKAAA